jgi:hypothetical protein
MAGLFHGLYYSALATVYCPAAGAEASRGLASLAPSSLASGQKKKKRRRTRREKRRRSFPSWVAEAELRLRRRKIHSPKIIDKANFRQIKAKVAKGGKKGNESS